MSTKPSDTEPNCAFVWHPSSGLYDHGGHRVVRQPLARNSTERVTQVLDLDDSNAGTALRELIHATEHGREACICPAGLSTSPAVGQSGFFQTLSGGSSGHPRRIRRTVQSWQASFRTNEGLFDITAADRSAVLGGLTHSLALYGALEALHLGADLFLLSPLRPDRQVRMLLRHRVTILYATPTQLRQLDCAGLTCPDLRVLLVGGAKLDETTRKLVGAIFPNASVHEFYGASETSFITMADRKAPAESVGRPYPGVQIAIRKGDGRACAAGETGWVWVKSPLCFAGYGEGRSGGCKTEDGWLTVGELGYVSQHGYLYLKGRNDRMVTIADQNAYPEEVEAVLLAQDSVRKVAVLARPDAQRGTVFVAFVELENKQPRNSDGLLRACRQALGAGKTPKEISFVSELPVLPSGKADLQILERWMASGTTNKESK